MSFVGPGPQKTPLGDDQILPALGILAEGIVSAAVDVAELIIPVPAAARLVRVDGVILTVLESQSVYWFAKEGGVLKNGAADYVNAYQLVYSPTTESNNANASGSGGQIGFNTNPTVPCTFQAVFAVGKTGLIQTNSQSSYSSYGTAGSQNVGQFSSIRVAAVTLEAVHIRAGGGAIKANSFIRWEAF
jgi:hypothetical protein